MKLDQIAEDLVITELQTLADRGERLSLLSEEVGLVDLGAQFPRVVVDPVDGSSNARRGLPAVAVMLTLLEGPTMSDVRAGYVIDVITGTRWGALRHSGLFRDGQAVAPMRMTSSGRIEALALHGQPRDLPRVWPLVKASSEFRNFWCVALMLAHTATGSLDLFCSPRRARTFDTSAGLLMVREAGGVVTDIEGRSLDDVPVDLRTRTTLLCSAHEDLHQLGLELLHRG